MRALGEEREQRDAYDADLAERVENVLKRAEGKVNVSESAELLKMHRTTIYRVYRPHG